MKLFRTLIAPVVIVAVAVTGITTAQARAEASDTAKVLMGLAAVGIIAHAIDKKRSSAAAEGAVTVTRDSRIGRDDWRNDGWRQDDWRSPKYQKSRLLPGECLRPYSTDRGIQRLMGADCVARNTRHLAKLPKDCRVRVYTRQGRDWAYGPRCLMQAGFRIEGVSPRNDDWRNDRRRSESDRDYDRRDTPRGGDHISWGN